MTNTLTTGQKRSIILGLWVGLALSTAILDWLPFPDHFGWVFTAWLIFGVSWFFCVVTIFGSTLQFVLKIGKELDDD